MYPSLEKQLTADRELQVFWDGSKYRALLYNDDCSEVIMEDSGISITDVLENLDTALQINFEK